MKILKYIGIVLLFLISCFIGLITFAIIIYGSNEKEINVKSLVSNKEFKALHESILKLSDITNIAVLPQNNYIVVDGTVINLDKRTYGEEPALGFNINYYQAGDKMPYYSINNLLSSRKIAIDSIRVMSIVEGMKETNISDIYIENKEICYRWSVSAMYGEEGIIYTKKNVNKDTVKFDVFKQIDDNFYHFANEE